MAKIIEFEHDIHSEDRGDIGVYFSESFYERENWPVEFILSEKQYNTKALYGHYKRVRLIQDRFSKSYKGGVRGFHGDKATWKYITCLSGKIKLVTWDIKQQIRQEFYLEDGKNSILIPPYYLNGHQCLTDVCIFHYKQSEYYENFPATAQWSVNYNDSSIAPNWDLEPRRVSQRDKNAISLAEFYRTYNWVNGTIYECTRS